MTKKAVFLATHPRACSTAFERMFLSHPDKITCFHEAFDEAFYYGPERLASRFMHDTKARAESGCGHVCYHDDYAKIEQSRSQKNAHGQESRVFIKCMARIIVPPNSKPASIAPSLLPEPQQNLGNADGSSYPYCPLVQEPLNPTVFPLSSLKSFQFTFLIRNPRLSIPSIYRLSTPPRCAKTGWLFFMPEDAGYLELRRLFDYLRHTGLIGSQPGGKKEDSNTTSSDRGRHHECPIVIVDADDLLANPSAVMNVYCKAVDIPFTTDMLDWSTAEKKHHGEKVFKKFEPFHKAVLNSSKLNAPSQRSNDIQEDDEYKAWIAEFGEAGAATIKQVVAANMEHYNYLKQFTLKI